MHFCFYFSIFLFAIIFVHFYTLLFYLCIPISPHISVFLRTTSQQFFPTLLCPGKLLPSLEAESHSQGISSEGGAQPALQLGQGEGSGHLGISIVAVAGLPEGQLVERPDSARIAGSALQQEAEGTHGFKGHQAAAAGVGRG